MFDYSEKSPPASRHVGKNRLDGFVTLFTPHLRYLTGYSGSKRTLFCYANLRCFLPDRFSLQRTDPAGNRPVPDRFVTSGNLIEEAASAKLLRGCKRIAVEKDHLPLGEYLQLRTNFPAQNRFGADTGVRRGVRCREE